MVVETWGRQPAWIRTSALVQVGLGGQEGDSDSILEGADAVLEELLCLREQFQIAGSDSAERMARGPVCAASLPRAPPASVQVPLPLLAKAFLGVGGLEL